MMNYELLADWMVDRSHFYMVPDLVALLELPVTTLGLLMTGKVRLRRDAASHYKFRLKCCLNELNGVVFSCLQVTPRFLKLIAVAPLGHVAHFQSCLLQVFMYLFEAVFSTLEKYMQ